MEQSPQPKWTLVRSSLLWSVLILTSWTCVLLASASASSQTPNVVGPYPQSTGPGTNSEPHPGVAIAPTGKQKVPTETRDTHRPNEQQHDPTEKQKTSWTDPLIFVTVGVGLIYAGILAVMWLQRNEMIAQRTDLRDSSERQLRAYITIRTAFVETTNSSVSPKVIFDNLGQTPAYSVKAVTVIALGAYPWDSRVPLPPVASQQGTIGPHVGFKVPGEPLKFGLSEQTRIAAENHAIWVTGRVEYVDAFRKNRSTNFRLYYHGPFNPGANLELSPDASGNEAE